MIAQTTPCSDLRSGFLAQATSDAIVAEHFLSWANFPLCHALHYLQMALEKFAKGVQIPPGSLEHPSFSHQGASRLFNLLKNDHAHLVEYQKRLGMRKSQRATYIIQLLPTEPIGRPTGLEIKSGSARKTAAQRTFDKDVTRSSPAEA